VVVVVRTVGDEGVAADSGIAAVVVELPGGCGDRLVPGAQAVTPRPKRAVVRTNELKRPRELFMIVPLRGSRESWMDPPDITFSPRRTG
jgi:hypothetical protein